jgi:hypothetical protein
MNAISPEDAAILHTLVERYGRDAIISALPESSNKPFAPGARSDLADKAARSRVRRRRSDDQRNKAVVWAHLQFLQKHRVQQSKKKLQIACDILEENLNRYLAGRRKQGAPAFRKMHFAAQKRARECSEFSLFMTGLLNQLEDLAISPDVILLPFLGEGTSDGLRTPSFDTHSIEQGGPMVQFGFWDDPRFSPVVTLVLDPTQKIFE